MKRKYFIRLCFRSGLRIYHMGRFRIDGRYAIVKGRAHVWAYPMDDITSIELEPVTKKRKGGRENESSNQGHHLRDHPD